MSGEEAAGILIDDIVGDPPPRIEEEEEVTEASTLIPDLPPQSLPVEDDQSTFVTGVDQIPLFKSHEGSNEPKDPSQQPVTLEEPEVSPEQIENALTSLLKSHRIPFPHMRPAVVRLANEKKLEALLSSNYRRAEAYENALTLLRRSASTEEVPDRSQKIFQTRQQFLESKRQQINEEYNAKIEKNQKSNTEKYCQLYDRHKFELEQFKSKWQDPDFLKQFNHPSPQLLELRHLEKKFALSQRYDEAKATKALADRLQKQEEEVMQEQIDSLMRKDFARLRQQQRNEVERMISHDDRLLEEVERQKQNELGTLKIAVKRLLGVKHHTTRMRPVGLLAKQNFGATSPRMKVEYLKYREGVAIALNVSPVDDETFEKLTIGRPKRPKSGPRAMLPPLSS